MPTTALRLSAFIPSKYFGRAKTFVFLSVLSNKLISNRKPRLLFDLPPRVIWWVLPVANYGAIDKIAEVIPHN